MDRVHRIGRRAGDPTVSTVLAGAPVATRYQSTRDPSSSVSFSQALLQGLAPDGGLYVPSVWPRADVQALGHETTLPRLAARLIADFVAGDPIAPQLPQITAD